MKNTKLDDNFKDITKFSEKSLKEVWDNKEDEVWKKASELRAEHEEKLAKIVKGKYISRKEFEKRVKG